MINKLKAEILFSRAQGFAELGKLVEAIELFDKAHSVNPNHSGIYLHKALALSDAGRYEDSVATISRAIEMNPTNSVYYMFLGRIHYDWQRFDEALQVFEKSISKSPQNALTQSYKALTLLAMGKIEEAYKVLKPCVNVTNPEFQSRLLVLCESFLFRANKPSRSLEENIHEEKPELGKEGGPFHKADQLLTRAVYYILAILYRIRYATDTKKKSAYLYCLEGREKGSLGDFEPAVQAYKKALSVFTDCDEAKEQLADIYFQTGDYKSSLDYLTQTEEYKKTLEVSQKKEGSAVDPNRVKNATSPHCSLCLALGIIYYKLGEYDKAAEKLISLAENGLKDYVPFYYLGLCSIAQNDTKAASNWFKKAAQRVNPKIAEKRLGEMMRICTSV